MKCVYYLTGMGGSLTSGLGEELLSRGYQVYGRELVGDFRKLSFQEQIDLITQDLKQKFWTKESLVIANSFGSYLFLNSQLQMKPYIGKIILLSPILGEFSTDDSMTTFVPPRSGTLFKSVQNKQFPIPEQCQIHVGEEDWQSNPKNVFQFGELTNIPVSIVKKSGHLLPKEYVKNILDNW